MIADSEKRKQAMKNPVVTASDLSKFNTQTKQLIQKADSQSLRHLFVTEDENVVMEQFEREKAAEVEKELGDNIKMPEVKKGWNEWAGDGINNQRHL